jgi:ELWxxDGT repeat protein
MRSISRLGRAGFEFFSIRVRLAPLLLAGSLPTTGASAQAPTLVKDIYPGLSSTASPVLYPDSFLGVSGNRAFLRAFSAQGFGLWVADDTAAPPRFLLDFPATSAPGVDLNGSFYFSAASPEGNWLWKTDGTVTGTIPVRRFPANLDHPVQLSKLTKVGGLLYFVTTEAEQAPKLWKSDGTEAGTTLVKALPLSAFGTFSSPRELVDLGGALVFSCHGSPGCGLWKSDGTDAGTVQVSSLDYPSSLLNLNGTLFFAASDPAHGSELWKSDGTTAGTLLVKDLVPGAGGSGPGSLVPFGGSLFFRIGSNGSVWRSDGTEAGTVLVSTLASAAPLVPSEGRIHFVANGTQLIASDGTEAGTALVQDFGTPVSLSTAAPIPGALLFWVDRGIGGLELWRSDGTPAGSTLVTLLEPGNEAQSPQASLSVGGAALFSLRNSSVNFYRSDGTAAGTVPVASPAFLPNDGLPLWLADANGTLFFSAFDPDHGNELWKSDGTPDGTVLVKDVQPGPDWAVNSPTLTTPSHVLFRACLPETGCELYRTDGTEAGTGLVKEIRPGPESGFDGWAGILGETLVLFSDDGEHGTEPWRSDGTPDGTFLLRDLQPGPVPSQIKSVGVLGNAYFFAASDGTTTTLWKTDGTTPGTAAVGPVPTVTGAGSAIGGALVFPTTDTSRGMELWKTDGSTAGTSLVLVINPSQGYDPSAFQKVGSRIVFWADDGIHGLEPWTTDGTATGTGLLKDIFPGPSRSIGYLAAALGETLFFWADDGIHGTEFWKTDGTEPGTLLVRDIAPGPSGSSIDLDRMVAAGHEVFFTASDHVSGRELWRSDGTEAGTTRVADLVPGLRCSPVPWLFANARWALARSGGRIFFTATDGTTGYELWSVPVPARLHTIVPCRVGDSRDPAGPSGGTPLGAGGTLVFQVTGRCGIPPTAISVAANVTVVTPSAAGSLSVFAGVPVPTGPGEVSFAAGKTRALHLLPNLGTAGTLSVRPSMPPGTDTHVVLDVSGYFE